MEGTRNPSRPTDLNNLIYHYRGEKASQKFHVLKGF